MTDGRKMVNAISSAARICCDACRLLDPSINLLGHLLTRAAQRIAFDLVDVPVDRRLLENQRVLTKVRDLGFTGIVNIVGHPDPFDDRRLTHLEARE